MKSEEIKVSILNIKKNIVDCNDKLISDNWVESINDVCKICEKLQVFLEILIQIDNDDIIQLQNELMTLLDVIMKAITFEDTIQLADLLGCDLYRLLDDVVIE